MEEDKSDLLDIENNIEFLFNILKGEKESFLKLKSWYDERILDKKRPIESYKRGVFKLIEFAYNINLEKKEAFVKKNEEYKNIIEVSGANSNISLETILKQINELKQKDEEKEKQINELKIKDEEKANAIKDQTNTINELKKKDEEKKIQINELKIKDEEKANTIKDQTNTINELKKKDEAIQKDQHILSSKNDIVKFINDVQIFINKENIYYNSIKIYCLNQKDKLNEVDVAVLKSMTLELYSFKNLSFYRKISYILLSEIIKENKEYIQFKDKFHVTNGDKNLINIITYFFWVKDSISQIIHFSKNARILLNAIIEKSEKEELSLKEIQSIKSIDDFYDGLEQYTNQSLIDCLDLSKPLLFFRQKQFDKGNINYSIENLLSKIKKNKDGESNEFHLKLLDLNSQIERINKNNYVKDIKDNKLIEEFNENANYVKTKSYFEKEIENIERFKNNIREGIGKLLEYKKTIKTNYFTFKDFTKYYIEIKQLKNFEPSAICKKLLKKKLNNKISFDESDDKKLEELLVKKK